MIKSRSAQSDFLDRQSGFDWTVIRFYLDSCFSLFLPAEGWYEFQRQLQYKQSWKDGFFYWRRHSIPASDARAVGHIYQESGNLNLSSSV